MGLITASDKGCASSEPSAGSMSRRNCLTLLKALAACRGSQDKRCHPAASEPQGRYVLRSLEEISVLLQMLVHSGCCL